MNSVSHYMAIYLFTLVCSEAVCWEIFWDLYRMCVFLSLNESNVFSVGNWTVGSKLDENKIFINSIFVDFFWFNPQPPCVIVDRDQSALQPTLMLWNGAHFQCPKWARSLLTLALFTLKLRNIVATMTLLYEAFVYPHWTTQQRHNGAWCDVLTCMMSSAL